LVTGASRGIGRAIAVELARVNYDVMITYATNSQAADESAEAIRAANEAARVAICRSNIAEASDREDLLKKTRDEFGRLDLLVNNAGVAPDQRVDLLKATVESFDRLIGVNLKGPYFLTQAVATWMIEQRAAGIAGFSPAIINISSVSAYAASPGRGDYCVSKAGLSMMTKLYAARLANEGINVYEIRPGVISTDMTADVKEKYDQLIDADLTPALKTMIGELRQAVGTANQLLQNTDATLLGANAPAQQELRDALQEISAAARSVRVLADYLDRHPEALIRGKSEDKP
jgi:NAD(P)-dependent dehydrogenase (short-subunit alcohol dehydrogenase family)